MHFFQNPNKKRTFGSKTIGIITLFLLIGIVSKSQEISTVKEIYDFNAGDIFHFETSTDVDEVVKNIEILDKFYSNDSNTVNYIRKINSETSSMDHPDWVFKSYIDTVSYHDLDSLINNGDIDSVYSNEELYNNRLINDYYNNYEYEDTYYSYSFVKGCGQAFYYWNQWTGWIYNTMTDELVYFKKGDEEWGEPIYVSVHETKDFSSAIKIFPNPAKGFIQINSANKEINALNILSISGENLRRMVIKSNKKKIDLSGLKPGLYIIQINVQGQSVYKKLIIE